MLVVICEGVLFFDLLFDIRVIHNGAKSFVVLVHGDESAEGLFVVFDVWFYRVYH